MSKPEVCTLVAILALLIIELIMWYRNHARSNVLDERMMQADSKRTMVDNLFAAHLTLEHEQTCIEDRQNARAAVLDKREKTLKEATALLTQAVDTTAADRRVLRASREYVFIVNSINEQREAKLDEASNTLDELITAFEQADERAGA